MALQLVVQRAEPASIAQEQFEQQLAQEQLAQEQLARELGWHRFGCVIARHVDSQDLTHATWHAFRCHLLLRQWTFDNW